MTKVDWADVESFEALPEGTYNVVFESFEVTEQSKASGKPFVNLTFIITDGDHTNRKLWRNHSLQPQALWALKQSMVRLGSSPDTLTGEMEIEEALARLQGNPCRLVVGQREYEGVMRNEIKEILSMAYDFAR